MIITPNKDGSYSAYQPASGNRRAVVAEGETRNEARARCFLQVAMAARGLRVVK